MRYKIKDFFIKESIILKAEKSKFKDKLNALLNYGFWIENTLLNFLWFTITSMDLLLMESLSEG